MREATLASSLPCTHVTGRFCTCLLSDAVPVYSLVSNNLESDSVAPADWRGIPRGVDYSSDSSLESGRATPVDSIGSHDSRQSGSGSSRSIGSSLSTLTSTTSRTSSNTPIDANTLLRSSTVSSNSSQGKPGRSSELIVAS